MDNNKWAQADLANQLARGEIDGATYNQKIIALTIPEEYHPPKKNKRGRGILAGFVCLVALSILVPVAILLNWRFYFKSTITAANLPDYSAEMISDIGSDPIQIPVEGVEVGEYKGQRVKIIYKDYYDITGVVASVYDYWGFDGYNTLVPRDVCLVWKNSANALQNHKIDVHQSNRFCWYSYTAGGIDPEESFSYRNALGVSKNGITTISNNHLIASSAEVRDKIFSLGTGDEVRLIGYLVTVYFEDGSHLDSSTSRNDGGDGACELIYVTKIETIKENG